MMNSQIRVEFPRRMRRMYLPLLIATAFLFSAISTTSHAQTTTCYGVTMPDGFTNESTNFVLNGMGLRRAKVLAFTVNVYVAGLYLTKKSGDAAQIIETDQPRYIVMYFLRDVSRKQIRDAIEESFRRNAGERISAMKQQINEFLKSLPNVKQGQTLSFSYIPKAGTTVILEGKERARIEGAQFASALSSLFLGIPPNRSLKAGMLGQQC